MAQDSLFWFDMNSVRDPMPKTPKVLDKIFGTSQLSILDSLKNSRVNTQDGFRLQIYESSSVEEANKKLQKFEKALDDSVYLIFDAPLYKIRTGVYSVSMKAVVLTFTNPKRIGLKLFSLMVKKGGFPQNRFEP